jgi:hypothetical protein
VPSVVGFFHADFYEWTPRRMFYFEDCHNTATIPCTFVQMQFLKHVFFKVPDDAQSPKTQSVISCNDVLSL